MILYIFRHGEAEATAESPEKTDESRRLTSEGREQVKKVCEEARKLGANPTVIMSSPLVRAKQTAEIAKEIMNPKADLKIDNCLEPESEPEEVYKALSRLTRKDEFVLVTHVPILGHLISDLVVWKELGDHIEFHNGAMMKIESRKTFPKSGSGTMVWLLPQM
jgi:phosphohistidine phosphatase